MEKSLEEDDFRVQLNHVSLEYLLSLPRESLSWCEPDSEAYNFGGAGGKEVPWESSRGEIGLLFKSTEFRTLRGKLLTSSGHHCRAH